jgi:hypothetical protein
LGLLGLKEIAPALHLFLLVYYTVEHIGKYHGSLDMSNQRTLNQENNEPRMRNTLRWTPVYGPACIQDVVFYPIDPFKVKEGLVTWVDPGGGGGGAEAGKGTRGAEEGRRRLADPGFPFIGYIIIESPSYPIPTGHNIYACRRRDWITRSLDSNGESSLAALELICSVQTTIYNVESTYTRPPLKKGITKTTSPTHLFDSLGVVQFRGSYTVKKGFAFCLLFLLWD